jgi:hypothetical protein
MRKNKTYLFFKLKLWHPVSPYKSLIENSIGAGKKQILFRGKVDQLT